MTARQIIRAEYGTSVNPFTPDVLRVLKARHPHTGEEGAVEISEGTQIPMGRDSLRRPMYGVSVVWVAADGSTRRSDPDFGGKTFCDMPTAEPWPTRGAGYREALAYCALLGARV